MTTNGSPRACIAASCFGTARSRPQCRSAAPSPMAARCRLASLYLDERWRPPWPHEFPDRPAFGILDDRVRV